MCQWVTRPFYPSYWSCPGGLSCRTAIFTPAHFFEPWSSETASSLNIGRSTLEPLRRRTVLALADSAFNAAELIALGYPEVRVAGLLLDSEKLLDVIPSPAVLARAESLPGPLVLMVGQLYPHKRADLVLAAFHLLLSRYRPDASLVLAGAARLHGYERAVRRYVDRLGIAGRTTVTGEISVEEMAAWYRMADLFVMASDHEGFGVPLVEAMLFDLPIIARSNGAVAETLGDAGCALAGGAGPSALGRAMGALLDDEGARSELQRRAQSRRVDFSLEATTSRFLEALSDVL